MGYAQVQVVADAMNPSDSSGPPQTISASVHNAAVILQQALQYIPNPGSECMLRNMAVRLAQFMGRQVSSSGFSFNGKPIPCFVIVWVRVVLPCVLPIDLFEIWPPLIRINIFS